MSSRIDMAGKRYGHLTAICDVGRVSSADRKWRFQCDCGALFEASGYAARSGKTVDCPACASARTGAASRTHGKSETPEFNIWTGMHTRCYNAGRKEFKDYGARGIVICERWRASFENFLADMGLRPSEQHSIERIDNDGIYEPSNCRWATAAEQSSNKRNNVKVLIDGVERTISEWARHFGVNVATACLRHKQGLRGEALFVTTVQQLTYSGITDTLAGWSRRTGIKQTTIGMRVNRYHWPVQRALTEGAQS